MPIHTWTRVPAGTYHFFHQRWIAAMADALNTGGLPPGYFAMSEVDAVSRGENTVGYSGRADRLSVFLSQGELVAVIEIVSPGNKDNQNGLKTFVRKAGNLLQRGVHLLIVDLFPPSDRDPQGIHKAIWDQFKEEPFELPPNQPFTIASYVAGSVKIAYVENVGVGDRLPEMPLFLTPTHYVQCPLDATYQVTWGVFPAALKGPLELPPGK